MAQIVAFLERRSSCLLGNGLGLTRTALIRLRGFAYGGIHAISGFHAMTGSKSSGGQLIDYADSNLSHSSMVSRHNIAETRAKGVTVSCAHEVLERFLPLFDFSDCCGPFCKLLRRKRRVRAVQVLVCFHAVTLSTNATRISHPRGDPEASRANRSWAFARERRSVICVDLYFVASTSLAAAEVKKGSKR